MINQLFFLGKSLVLFASRYFPIFLLANTGLNVLITAFNDFKAKKEMNALPKVEDLANGEIPVSPYLRAAALMTCEFKSQLPDHLASKIKTIACAPMSLKNDAPTINTYCINMSTREHAIVIDEGIFPILNAYEFKAILAHEISHITLDHLDKKDAAFRWLNAANGTTILCSTMGLIFFSLKNALYSSEELPYVTAILLASITIAKSFANYSQKIELQADKESVRLNNDGKALISALEKLDSIEIDLIKKSPNKNMDWSRLFSHHPNTKTRKKALGLTDKIDSDLVLGSNH